MKLKVSLLALFVAGLIVSVAIAGPAPSKGKPPGKGNGNGNGAASADGNGKGKKSGTSTSLSTSTSTSTGSTTTTTPSGKKVQVCHRTSSKKRPYALMSITRKALKAHMRYGDVLPGNGLCRGSTVASTTTTTTTTTTAPARPSTTH